MVPISAMRKSSSATLLPGPSQPSQLWARRMGAKAEALRVENVSDCNNKTTPLAVLSTQRPSPLSVPATATSSVDYLLSPAPPLSAHSIAFSHSAPSCELKPLTPLGTRNLMPYSLVPDIWTPSEKDFLNSPLSGVATPAYERRGSASEMWAPTEVSLSPTSSRSADLAQPSMPTADSDNMSVAIQVAMQIIGQDGGYDSDDEDYRRQALHWLASTNSKDGKLEALSGNGIDESGHNLDGAACTGEGSDATGEGQPKRKGRARMSQEKRRRLARRKEREALMLLGLPPLPASAPAQSTTFRLPPLITNTLASVASSNLPPGERAAAVEAAKVLIASTGLLQAEPRTGPLKSGARGAGTDTLDRRQGSAPNLRTIDSLNYFKGLSHSARLPSAESIDFDFARLQMDDKLPRGPRGFRTNSAASTMSHTTQLSSCSGMPSLSRGASVSSSPASTPLQTPEMLVHPLPPTSVSLSSASDDGSQSSPHKAFGPSFHQDTHTQWSPFNNSPLPINQKMGSAVPSLPVPNVRVLPPTPYSKVLQQSKSNGHVEVPRQASASIALGARPLRSSTTTSAGFALGPKRDDITSLQPQPWTSNPISRKRSATSNSSIDAGRPPFPVYPGQSNPWGADDLSMSRIEAQWGWAPPASKATETSSLIKNGNSSRPSVSSSFSPFHSTHFSAAAAANSAQAANSAMMTTSASSEARHPSKIGLGMSGTASPPLFASDRFQRGSSSTALGLQLNMGGPLD
ncbi:hypothetical protein OC846_001959 [Tilletia horrida]|uniref:Uncharacterized protein n=1 Tax=Tilletia horrida TaxID=155126 RepID=A0AAN6GS85_9BASI|nr:hypothetical protein OC846_001959 [Tilletia horrida]